MHVPLNACFFKCGTEGTKKIKNTHTHNKQKLGSFYCIQTKEMNHFSYHINCRGNRIACIFVLFHQHTVCYARNTHLGRRGGVLRRCGGDRLRGDGVRRRGDGRRRLGDGERRRLNGEGVLRLGSRRCFWAVWTKIMLIRCRKIHHSSVRLEVQ